MARLVGTAVVRPLAATGSEQRPTQSCAAADGRRRPPSGTGPRDHAPRIQRPYAAACHGNSAAGGRLSQIKHGIHPRTPITTSRAIITITHHPMAGPRCAYMLVLSRYLAQQVHPLGTWRSTRLNHHPPLVSTRPSTRVHSTLRPSPPDVHPSPLDRPSLAPCSSLACPRVVPPLPRSQAARSRGRTCKAASACLRALLRIECCGWVDEWSTRSAN